MCECACCIEVVQYLPVAVVIRDAARWRVCMCVLERATKTSSSARCEDDNSSLAQLRCVRCADGRTRIQHPAAAAAVRAV